MPPALRLTHKMSYIIIRACVYLALVPGWGQSYPRPLFAELDQEGRKLYSLAMFPHQQEKLTTYLRGTPGVL